MISRVLVIGGYGNFGQFICRSLAKDSKIKLIIAGRTPAKAHKLLGDMEMANPAEVVSLDINHDLFNSLELIKPDIVIHTSGPFQDQGYNVVECCIKLGAHYIDLADARDFVTGINCLHQRAVSHDVLLVSGASSVPCLTSAVIDHYISEFKQLESVDYGITTAQKTTRGQATTAAILSYTGKAFTTQENGKSATVYGWQGLRLRRYKQLGWRFLSYCNIPDLSLFPERYPTLKNIHFYAGLEISFIHITLWMLSWLVRIGLIKNLEQAAPLLLRISFLFDWLGTANSGFYMRLCGRGDENTYKELTFELTARSGDGPYIPCIPAILMTKKLVHNELDKKGAYPCVDFISLEEYLDALKELDISWQTRP